VLGQGGLWRQRVVVVCEECLHVVDEVKVFLNLSKREKK